jgi:hypothetical protein
MLWVTSLPPKRGGRFGRTCQWIVRLAYAGPDCFVLAAPPRTERYGNNGRFMIIPIRASFDLQMVLGDLVRIHRRPSLLVESVD